jgi:hypothetical protein
VNKKRKKSERVDDLPAPKKGKHVGKIGGKGGGGKRRSPENRGFLLLVRLMYSNFFVRLTSTLK